MNLNEEDLNDSQLLNIIIEETILQQVLTEAERNNDKNLQKKLKDA
jgi:hypothetical protein